MNLLEITTVLEGIRGSYVPAALGRQCPDIIR